MPEARLKLLVLGGSLGAQSLNKIVPAALQTIEEHERPEVRHQCGKKHIEACQSAYKEAGVKAEINAFISDMAAAYHWADLVICRAGALTVAEIAAAGVPAILVPYPYAVDDHQTRNAAMLVDVGAARLVADGELDAEKLATVLMQLKQDRAALLTMAKAAKQVAKKGSASRIADLCVELAHG